ncbi:hypothetical protein HMPREF0294_0566 [Corynebacterium glucuronolyticum ATCC 51867]|nr:hypothetical protein HMPREF0294_0566 [Corynebacterium glucuronolyticum ATCC 51867]
MSITNPDSLDLPRTCGDEPNRGIYTSSVGAICPAPAGMSPPPERLTGH